MKIDAGLIVAVGNSRRGIIKPPPIQMLTGTTRSGRKNNALEVVIFPKDMLVRWLRC
jgi:hypothetical protein